MIYNSDVSGSVKDAGEKPERVVPVRTVEGKTSDRESPDHQKVLGSKKRERLTWRDGKLVVEYR